MGKKFKSVRWKLYEASQEFEVDVATLSKKIKLAGITPGGDGCFCTMDIVRAAFGDIAGEKLRLVREQADAFAIKNAAARGELLPVADVRRHLEAVLIAQRSGILSSNLLTEEKSELLTNLKRLGESIRTNEPNRESVDEMLANTESSTATDGEPVEQ